MGVREFMAPGVRETIAAEELVHANIFQGHAIMYQHNRCQFQCRLRKELKKNKIYDLYG